MRKYLHFCIVLGSLTLGVALFMAYADPFTEADLKKWNEAYMAAVKEGDSLFHSSNLGRIRLGDMCHPNASNSHPETYPKFQKQLGKVVGLRDMINWCIQNPWRELPCPQMTPDGCLGSLHHF